MRLYIAGPITNTPDFRERFEKGEMEVAALGYLPVNPLEVCTAINFKYGAGTSQSWLPAMKANICALLECDGIYLLQGWEKSKGASLERYIAEQLGLQILNQE